MKNYINLPAPKKKNNLNNNNVNKQNIKTLFLDLDETLCHSCNLKDNP